MNFIANLKAKAPSNSLKARLHKAMSRNEPARSTKTLHASELTKPDFCARRYALMDRLGVKPQGQFISTAQSATFALGHAVQGLVIEWLVGAQVAVSDWQCDACGQRYAFTKHPIKCSGCGRSDRLIPREPRIVSASTGASGGIDVFADMGGLRPLIVEVKSIGADDFKKLVEPLPEHILRTKLYLAIAADLPQGHPLIGRIELSRAKVLYASKGGFGALDASLQSMGVMEKYSPFKEFDVEREDATVAVLLAEARAIHDYRWGEAGMPPRKICSGPHGLHAKHCPVGEACFSAAFPPGQANPHPWVKDAPHGS